MHFAHVVGFNHYNLQLAAAKAGLRVVEIVNPDSGLSSSWAFRPT